MTTLKQFLHDKSNKSEVDKYFEDQAKLVLEKRKLEVIDNFNDYFDFLNNEYPCQVYYQGLIYRSVAHAYQAARSDQQHIREKIGLADTLQELYDIASKVEDPPNWQNDRLRVMEKLLRDKFRRNRDLRDKLKATGTRELINTYWEYSTSNVYWGVVEGKGQNQLGRLLSNIRHDIIHNVEIDKWLFSTFELQDDKFFIPKIFLEVAKQDQVLQKIPLVEKSYYLMGKLKTVDVTMEHPSLSRNHAAIIVDQEQGVCLVDLGSKSGSYVDGKRIGDGVPQPLKSGQKLNFGASTRTYKIEIDYSDVEKNIEIRKRKIEQELKMVEKTTENASTAQLFKSTQPDLLDDTIFVKYVPTTATKKDIEELFSKYGKVKEVRIPMDRKTGTQKSICFVTFKDAADCKKALSSAGVGLKIGEEKLKIMAAKRQETRDDDRVDRGKYARDSKKYEERGREDIERRHSKRGDRRSEDRKRDSKRSRRDSRERKNGRDRSREKDRKKKDKMEEEGSASDSDNSSVASEKKDKKKKKSRDRSVEKKKAKKPEKEEKEESKRDTKVSKQEDDSGKRESAKARDRSSSSSESKGKRRKKRSRSRSSTPDKKRDRAKDKRKARRRSRSRSASKERRRSPKEQENKKKNAKKEEKIEEEESSDSSDDSSSSGSDSDSSASD